MFVFDLIKDGRLCSSDRLWPRRFVRGSFENFDTFVFSLREKKTASMSTGLDSLLLRPSEFDEQTAQAKARIQSLKMCCVL